MGDISIYQGGALKTTKTPTTGQLPVGSSATGDFNLGSITSTGGTVTITYPSNNINLEVVPATVTNLSAGYGTVVTIPGGSTTATVSTPIVNSVGSSTSATVSLVIASTTTTGSYGYYPVTIFEINNTNQTSLTINPPIATDPGPGVGGALVDGQRVIIRISTSVVAGTVVGLGTSASGPQFAGTQNIILPISNNKIYPNTSFYIGLIYNSSANKWNVVAVS